MGGRKVLSRAPQPLLGPLLPPPTQPTARTWLGQRVIDGRQEGVVQGTPATAGPAAASDVAAVVGYSAADTSHPMFEVLESVKGGGLDERGGWRDQRLRGAHLLRVVQALHGDAQRLVLQMYIDGTRTGATGRWGLGAHLLMVVQALLEHSVTQHQACTYPFKKKT